MRSPYLSQLRLSQGLSHYLHLEAHQKTLNQHYGFLKDNNKPLVMTEVIIPPEIFHALGLKPLFMESFGSFLASVKMNNRIIKAAEDTGISTDICSYHKCSIGAMKSEYIPVPEYFINSSYWCDDMIKVAEYLCKEYGKKSFIIDLPFTLNNHALQYVAEQFKAMAGFLSKETGIPFTHDSLIQSIKLSNQAREYWRRVNERRKISPAVVSGTDLMGMLPMLLPKFGHPATLDIFKTLYKEILELQKKKIQKEKHRLLWLHFYPFYARDFMTYIERDLHAAIAFEETSFLYWEPLDEKKPFMSLARKMLHHPGFGSIEKRVNTIEKLVDDYKIDGVVHFSQVCCRPYRGGVSFIRDTLRKKGIPFLEITGDVLDGRCFSKEQLKTRIEAFLEILGDNGNETSP